MENIKSVIEAIIFSSGSAVDKKELCEKVPALTTAELNKIIKELQKKYDENSGVVLLEFNGKVQFSSNPKYGETVAEVLTPLREKELTKTLLEVLSTIAYKQPITRLEIDDMRGGTNSEYAISGLLRAGLIEAVGRKDTVGRPLLYGTTDEFLKKFGLEELVDLPDYDEVLEKIRLIYTPPQEGLFHTRSLYDEEGNLIEENAALLEHAAADMENVFAAPADEDNGEEDEIPEFLQNEKFEIFD
jgi:segregation and condensation protein B